MQIEILSHRSIAVGNRHHGFTDLAKWKGRYYCAFREGDSHISRTGRTFVMASDDLENWEVNTIVQGGYSDVRDPKLLATEDRLFVYCPVWDHRNQADVKFEINRRLSVYSYTDDGREWTDPDPVYEPGWAFWRPITHGGVHYVASYKAGKDPNSIEKPKAEDWRVGLLRSEDGIEWEHVSDIWSGQTANETQIIALDDGRLLALVRREHRPKGYANNCVAVAEPPYTDWRRSEVKNVVQGPAMCKLGGHILVGGRTYHPPYSDMIEIAPQMSLLELDTNEMQTKTIMHLPSWGDCSYPGFVVLSDDEVAVSYYSSHELTSGIGRHHFDKAKVFITRIRLNWED